MAGPNQDELNDIAFECGVDANGNVTSPAFADWAGTTNPTTYNTAQDSLAKWDNDAFGNAISPTGTAGVGSGTITYSFGSGVTGTEQTAFTNTLAVWSDEANLTFAQAPTGAKADVVFNVTSSGGTDNQAAPFTAYDTVGSKNISTNVTPNEAGGAADTITFNDSGPYGTLGNFSAEGGYGVGALTHEVGHMIGLGHAGPYNDGSAGSNPSTSQFNEYDSRQWSVMSYIDPSDTTATYYKDYPVTGTSWTSTQGNLVYQVAPETPMTDDILAAQRLYGASTNGVLAGGQTFGFNCNVTGGANSFFNFAVNTNPVVTLYDTGIGNSLDVSGFSTNCSINLNPGTFSTASAGTLTNNIGIAYGTRIDTAIGGSGNDTFTVNADSDTIEGGIGSNTAIFSGAESGYTIANTAGTNNSVVTDTATGAVDTLTNVHTLQFSNATVTVCFAAGTRLRTPHGDVAVEHLRVGDLVTTTAGAQRPIRWIGHRRLDCRRHPSPETILPIRIAAHAFGASRPARDLVVSPGHAICLDVGGEVLIPAGALVDGATIRRTAVEAVTYWHIELESHDIVLAENLPAESYLDMGNRTFFAEARIVDLSAAPDEALQSVHSRAGFCRPFVDGGPLVEAVRRRVGTPTVNALTVGAQTLASA